jgi:hypothetical protein
MNFKSLRIGYVVDSCQNRKLAGLSLQQHNFERKTGRFEIILYKQKLRLERD